MTAPIQLRARRGAGQVERLVVPVQDMTRPGSAEAVERYAVVFLVGVVLGAIGAVLVIA